MQIPLYQSHAQTSTQVAATPMSSGAASATGRAVAGLGEKVGAIAGDYQARRQELRNKADLSDYEVQRRQLETNLVKLKSDATQNGVSYTDMYDEVVAPAMAEFGTSLAGRNYSKAATAKIGERWQLDSENITRKEVVSREKMEIADYVSRRQAEADALLFEGDSDGADAIYKDLEGTVGESAAQSMKSLSLYNLNIGDISGVEENRIDNLITDDQFLSQLEGVRNGLKSSDMNENHKRSIKNSLDAKINNFKGRRVSSFKKAVESVNDKVAKDDLEMEDYIILKQDAGEPYADAFSKSMEPKLKALAVSDKDATKAVKKLTEFKKGEMSWTQVLRETSSIGGSIGTMSVAVAAQYAKEVSLGSSSINAFELWYRDQKMIIRGFSPDFISTVADYSENMPDGQSEFVNTSMKHIAKWQKQNPDATQEEYDEMKRMYFKLPAEKEVQRQVAPQIEGSALPIGTVEDGYKYIGGDRYSESSWEKQ